MLKKKNLFPFIEKTGDDGLYSLITKSYYFMLLFSFLVLLLTFDYFLRSQSGIWIWILVFSIFIFAFYPGEIQTKIMNFIYNQKENIELLKMKFISKETLDKETLSIIKKDFGEDFTIKMFKINSNPNCENFFETLELFEGEQKIIKKVNEI